MDAMPHYIGEGQALFSVIVVLPKPFTTVVTAQSLWLTDHWASEIFCCEEMRLGYLYHEGKSMQVPLLAFYFLMESEVFIPIPALEIWSPDPVISTSNAACVKKINYKTEHKSGTG